MLYASSTLALSCLEVLVHIRDASLAPYDYLLCEITVPDEFVAHWNLTGETALAKIESEVLSREWGDAWLKGHEEMPMPPLAGLTMEIPEREVRQAHSLQRLLKSCCRLEEARFRFTPFLLSSSRAR